MGKIFFPDEVTFHYPNKFSAVNGLMKWREGGFMANHENKTCVKIVDSRNLGSLRTFFDIFTINKLEKEESGLKIEISWQHIKLNDIVREVVEKLREEGFKDVKTAKYKTGIISRCVTIKVEGKEVLEIFKERWIFEYKRKNKAFKRSKEIHRILIPILESFGVKEYDWR